MICFFIGKGFFLNIIHDYLNFSSFLYSVPIQLCLKNEKSLRFSFFKVFCLALKYLEKEVNGIELTTKKSRRSPEDLY